MKIRMQILGVLCFVVVAFVSCQRDAPNSNVIFLTSAETSVTTSLTVDTTGGAMAITAKSSQLVASDAQATVELDTTLIAKYNQETGKSYSALPPGSYSLSSSNMTIKAGQNISDGISFQVTTSKVLKDGVSYLMPVTIRSASGLPILDASKTLYIVVNKVIVNTVASLASNYFTVDFSKNNDDLKSMSNISYEARVMVNSFQSASPFISTIMGIEENFLLRFGDVTVQPNQLQMAGGATATNVGTPFSTGIWYHIAAVYNGSQLIIYVNGQVAATTSAVRTVDLTNGTFYFGKSTSQGRYLNGAIGEARIWSRALTQAEVVNGMCVVDPSSSGLVGYWKFNEGTGMVAHDISGNGHDATAASTVKWIPNIRCN
ncbi:MULTISPECIES: DUF1735 and LamG domain-containing protein [Chitinophagaceae]